LPGSSSAQRLVFLDVVRAFAILMMLQGHFIDTMLAPVYRDPANPLYAVWAYMRGITAPLFFFSSGLVFTYLLSREVRPLSGNPRLYKGLQRAAQLLVLGYLLRLSFPALMAGGPMQPWYWGADVLHIIGLSLAVLCGLYAAHRLGGVPLAPLLGLGGLLVFYAEPYVSSSYWLLLPDALAAYLINLGYSTFTLFPWLGYALLGGMAGAILARRTALASKNYMPLLLIASGLMLHLYSIPALDYAAWLSGLKGLQLWRSENSHLLVRLGDAWVVIGLIMGICRLLPRVPALISRIGRETLLIYSVHYVLLFGTWFGFGIRSLGAKAWGPWQVATGAGLFVLGFVLLIRYLDQIEAAALRVKNSVLLPAATYVAALSAELAESLMERAALYRRLYRMKMRG
jgi:uncharacterized membrane protein